MGTKVTYEEARDTLRYYFTNILYVYDSTAAGRGWSKVNGCSCYSPFNVSRIIKQRIMPDCEIWAVIEEIVSELKNRFTCKKLNDLGLLTEEFWESIKFVYNNVNFDLSQYFQSTAFNNVHPLLEPNLTLAQIRDQYINIVNTLLRAYDHTPEGIKKAKKTNCLSQNDSNVNRIIQQKITLDSEIWSISQTVKDTIELGIKDEESLNKIYGIIATEEVYSSLQFVYSNYGRSLPATIES